MHLTTHQHRFSLPASHKQHTPNFDLQTVNIAAPTLGHQHAEQINLKPPPLPRVSATLSSPDISPGHPGECVIARIAMISLLSPDMSSSAATLSPCRSIPSTPLAPVRLDKGKSQDVTA
ncbi:hypothetical protein FOMPIDRAFT_1056280 [Fomitopsis schrenkii]|uniref:Uncharacterized protein n=1 Tax=Fomitopsis schrenkii TaxID=2126942 RepID=S8DJW9_FOMSC|nr:hypothetical protein FOMPIDRAFT_1056280 [Fomitopsis schrenkii]